MTQNKVHGEQSGFWTKYSVIIIAVVILAGLMLPPVKKLLNSIPYFWSVLYPLLTLFSLYILLMAIQEKEETIVIIKWVLLFISAAAMAAAIFGLGVTFYTVGRTVAVIFIVVELATFLYEVFAKT